MKPRLKSAPRTREDCDIGLQRIGDVAALTYDAADRRDADLMLQCQRWRAMGLTADMQVPGWINEGPGWQPVGGDITNCA